MGSKHDNPRDKSYRKVISILIFLSIIISQNSNSTEVYICDGFENNYKCYPLPETFNSQNELITYEPQEKELTEDDQDNYDFD